MKDGITNLPFDANRTPDLPPAVVARRAATASALDTIMDRLDVAVVCDVCDETIYPHDSPLAKADRYWFAHDPSGQVVMRLRHRCRGES